ncbi:MAG: DNA polymerase III subunit psi [Pseudarcicella sp.]|nr:DNA polymerase III subunit psi [Pseudarcicella sp.]MBP6410561.1 DNA polymerase III subunit psi [Pseudarcicella sp.]
MVQENTTFLLQQLFKDETIYRLDINNAGFEIKSILEEKPKIVHESTLKESAIVEIQKPKHIFTPYVFIVKSFSVAEKELLAKILTAVNLTLENVTILTLEEAQSIDFKWVLNNEPVRYFITFGIELQHINLKIPLELYVAKQIKGIQFLMSDSLEAMQADNTKKRLIWNALKQIFEI